MPERGTSVTVLDDADALAVAAADFFVSAARDSIASSGSFVVALSGGTTPVRFYTLLGSREYRVQVEWSKAHFFWADERCVPPEHPSSNFKLAFDAFLSTVQAPPENLHRIRGEAGPERAAMEYEEEMRRFFNVPGVPVFDLIVLGMGEDGHTASLFPGAPQLEEMSRLAVPVPQKKTYDRVTLTVPVLRNAARVLFLVSGRAKAAALHEILDKKNVSHYPAALIQPLRGKVRWLVDQQAAEKLQKTISTTP